MGLCFFILSCKPKSIPPTNEEAMDAVVVKGKPQGFDTIWAILPKSIYQGTSGGSVTILKENDESRKIDRWVANAKNLGMIEVNRVEEPTGGGFFSQAEYRVLDYINPTPAYAEYFKENPSNPNQWKVAWAVNQNFRFANLKYKEGKGYYKPDEVAMFYETDKIETPMNKVFQNQFSSNSYKQHFYYVFKKDSTTSKWIVTNYGVTGSEEDLEPIK